ncbi:DUF695 domain-containing protein [Sphingobacterium sp. CZ-UAM]|uniref:DUF695 domain-containing protein n=1 Tax=Sphingobacterium sp. CZ-UAM TaxID=1933868 RepID=UPI000984442B|nr:DUF695 domain-containing protein [Sphingobacterium sp. CZ-UAM]OOG18505.1 DUF695 domain-containing protein [Sphingobacterium sp. CZ-UAM]
MGFLNNIFRKKENRKDSIQDFWNWFEKNEQTFFQIVKNGDHIDQNFFSKLSPKIDALRKDLYFLTGMCNDDTAELIITPDGVVKNIAFVETLINAAPALPNWKFTALKPAVKDMEKFKITMYGFSFDINDMSFYPIEHQYRPDEVDIVIVHPKYTEEDKANIAHGVEIFLDNYIGELNSIITIDNLNVTSSNQAAGELIPLIKLKDYLIWREKEFVEKYTDVRHEAENDSYTAFEGMLQNDLPILAIINTSLLDWNGKASHPWIVTLRINYNGTATNGMPDQLTYDLMDKFEDDLMSSLPQDIGHLNIGRETADNIREVYLACTEFRKSSQTIDQLIGEYQNKLDIDYAIYKDKYWNSFERFNKTIE